MAEHPRHEMEAQRRFDRWSRSGTFQRLKPWLSIVQREVLSCLDWTRVSHVLDVGCGSGWAVVESAGHLDPGKPGFSCGCDISVGMLQQRSPDNGDSRALFTAASGQSLPFATGSFDAILCTAAFHHLPDPGSAMAEFRRVLRPGGRLIIVDTCRDQSLGHWIWDRLHRWFEPGHVKYYRLSELSQLIQDGGFMDLTVKELNPTYAESRKLVRKSAIFSAQRPGN